MHTAPDRKLTAILAADAAGYSAMMGRDEPGTLALLKTSREMMAGEIANHRGRVVGTAGDSLLAEFASVVNAVECAVRIQRVLAERNAGVDEAARMRFRIGINLGDVMVDGDDLFGEGVNVAARLQALAEPGGILISGAVFDQVRTKLSLGFDFLGPQAVKNISDPVPAWRVVLDAEGARAGCPGASHPLPERERVASELAQRPGEGDAATHEPIFMRSKRSARAPRSPAQRLKRRAAFAAIPIAIVFAVNMLTYTDTIWFHWPTLGILAIFALRTAWTIGR